MGGWNIYYTEDGKEYKKSAGHYDPITKTTPIWIFELGKFGDLMSRIVEEYYVKTGGVIHGVHKSYNEEGKEEKSHYVDGVCTKMADNKIELVI
jgi:hypothetical protein